MESAIYGVLDVMIKVLLQIVDAGDDDEGDEGDDDALGQRPHQFLMESSWCTAIERLDCKQAYGLSQGSPTHFRQQVDCEPD